MNPPSRGMFSVPVTFCLETALRKGMIAPRAAKR